jgi:hypothetical protein
MDAETDTNSIEESLHQTALRQFFNRLGVEIEPPAAVYMDDTNGTLIAHTSLQNLDKIEAIVSILSQRAK